MYYFIYESGKLSDKQAKLLDIITLKFSDLGINYDKVMVSPLRTADILAHDAILEGKYKALIAVGSDKTASQVINAIVKLKYANDRIKNWPLFGMVPLENSRVANALGLPYDEKICGILTRRKIETFDLGRADGNYFLTSFDLDILERKKSLWDKVVSTVKSLSSLKLAKINLDVDKTFTVQTKLSNLSVVNSLSNYDFEGKNQIKLSEINPKDEVLDLIMFTGNKEKTKETDLSFFRGKKIKFFCKEKLIMRCDDQPIKKVPEKFEIVPKAIEVIVGKRKRF